MRARAIFVVLAVLALAGCRGAKDTCEGSYKSWTACLANHDWESAYEMLTPEHKRKAVDPAHMARGMEEHWEGAKSFSFTLINLAETKSGVCTANGEMSYTIKIRGDNPYDVNDEYFAWTFRQGKDEKWYIEIPGLEKIGAF
jgi:hypothetical protein